MIHVDGYACQSLQALSTTYANMPKNKDNELISIRKPSIRWKDTVKEEHEKSETQTCTYILTNVHLYICTYIPWTHKCVIKIVQCGTKHKYTNIHI